MRKSSLLFLICLVLSVSSLFYFEPPKAQTAQGATELFALINTQRTNSSVSFAGVREQEIRINFNDISFETVQTLSIPLLDGKSYQAIRRESEGFVQFAADEFTWRGKIYGDNDWSGDAILTIKGQALSGLIYSPEAVYEIVPQEEFKHLLVQIDQSRFPLCGGGIPAKPEAKTTEAQPKTQASLDNGSQIDVMIVYTAAVRTALGGTTQSQAFAQQAISTTNTVYQNSGINTRLRLVQAMEVNYADNGNGLAGLKWVTDDATVAAARNNAKADMVALITENASDVCGIAWIMTDVDQSFESAAFSLSLNVVAPSAG